MNNKIRLVPDRITALENEWHTLTEQQEWPRYQAKHARLDPAYACDLKSFHV